MDLVKIVKKRIKSINDAHKGIKNDPEKTLPILKNLFKDPKDIFKILDLKFSVNHYIRGTEVWSELAEDKKNWYDGTKSLLERINLNVEIKGLENLTDIDKNTSVVFGSPHNHELEALPIFAVIGYYLYHSLEKKNMKMIVNLALKAIKNFEEVGFFVMNDSHSADKSKINKYNKKVFVREVIPFLKYEKGLLVHFLTEKNPCGFRNVKYAEADDSIETLAKYTDKVVPVYVDWPRAPFISRSIISRLKVPEDKKWKKDIVRLFRDLNRARDFSRLHNKSVTLYIGKPISRQEVTSGQYIMDKCFELKEEYKDKKPINLKDLPN